MTNSSGKSKRSPAKTAGERSSFWHWIRDNVETLKVTFLVVAGMFAVFEYRSKDYIERVKNSSDIVEKYFASDEHQALLKVVEFEWSDEYIGKRKQLDQKLISSEQFHAFVAAEVKKKYSTEFHRAIRGMKTVSICAIQGRCEPSSICLYLSQTMQDFRCDFREVVAELSITNGSCIIDEINYVLDNYCRNWVASYMGVPEYLSIKDNYCLFDKERNRSLVGEACIKSIIFKRPPTMWDGLFD